MPAKVELKDWRSAIEQLSSHYPIMILEQELGPDPEFALGKPLRTNSSQVEFVTFNGVAKWEKEADRLSYSSITSLQVNTRYCNFYQRYFEDNPPGKKH